MVKGKAMQGLKKLQTSPNLQIYRKLLHLLMGAAALLIGFSVAQFYGLEVLLYGAFICFIILLLIDLLRVEYKVNFPLYSLFTKEKEKTNLHALTFAFLAAIIVIMMYEFKIALAAVAMSIFSDGIAAIIGIRFGRHRIWNGKSIEGSLASLATNLLIGYFIVGAWYIFIPMAVIATLTELVITHMDDNFVVPIFSGFVGQLILLLTVVYL
ncbi:hypothetical protein HYV81_06025 [Candidatus Woesearchaeota archaeon]|nr:hypothetical protein [Candidatus Woesearchaeota archaeon]